MSRLQNLKKSLASKSNNSLLESYYFMSVIFIGCLSSPDCW